MRAVARSETGRVRASNQDRYLLAPDRRLFVVCDGMGGHRCGDVAASLAVEAIDAAYVQGSEPVRGLKQAIETANREVYARGSNDPPGLRMGTTLAAAVVEDHQLYAANVGDSRIYLVRGDSIKQVSRDHTLVQRLAEAGTVTRDEARRHPYRHVLTRALGMEPQVEIDFFTEPIATGSYVLLATDGLTDLVADEEIQHAVARWGLEALDPLVAMALDRGGHDNITAVLIQV